MRPSLDTALGDPGYEPSQVLSKLEIHRVIFDGASLFIMLKRLGLWKYGIAVAIIFGCAFYVSQQYQHATEYCQEKVTKGRPSPHKENPDKCAEDAEKHFPSWYRLFSWPEGIGTWAILLTLLVISEQTNQTRRSAEVSELQAKVWREAIVI